MVGTAAFVSASASTAAVALRVVIIPGNGCESLVGANWYLWMAERLRSEGHFAEVVAQTMPDPHAARRKIWLPFLLGALAVVN